MTTVEDYKEALLKLDADGWNTEESVMKAAQLRTSMLLGYIREDLLGLSLRSDCDDITLRVK